MTAARRIRERRKFLWKNLGRGLIWLVIIVALFILFKDNEYINNLKWLEDLSGMQWLVYLIFLISEIVFGIFPPEFFMIWSIKNGISDFYIVELLALSLVSYGAGVLGYYLGNQFSHTELFKKIDENYLSKYKRNLRRFSGYVLFVAAVTPLPFSAMCMLVGSIQYPLRYFLLITLTRFARFFVYGYFIWQANTL